MSKPIRSLRLALFLVFATLASLELAACGQMVALRGIRGMAVSPEMANAQRSSSFPDSVPRYTPQRMEDAFADNAAGGVTRKASHGAVNVLRYCPKADGKTDNTECMQKAVDSLHSSGGGKLFLPYSKSCYVVDHIQIYSHLTIYSDNRQTCVQRVAGPASGISSVYYSDVAAPIEDVHFRQFTIDGNRANVTGPVGGTIGIALFGASE